MGRLRAPAAHDGELPSLLPPGFSRTPARSKGRVFLIVSHSTRLPHQLHSRILHLYS